MRLLTNYNVGFGTLILNQLRFVQIPVDRLHVWKGLLHLLAPLLCTHKRYVLVVRVARVELVKNVSANVTSHACAAVVSAVECREYNNLHT